MKKLLMGLMLIFTVTGCMDTMNTTPTKEVEKFLLNYQTLNEDVLADLTKVADEETAFNKDQKEEYINIMKKNYQNLKYHVKNEIIDGAEATVLVEIEVTDLSKAIDEANLYLKDNKEEFTDEEGNYNEELFTTYKLKRLKEMKDTRTYDLEITLSKVDKEWRINNLSETDLMKLQGLYN